MEFWLGLMTASWLFTVGAVVYVMYRYVYLPWKVMRKDLAALDAKIEEVRQTATTRRAEAMTEEEAAFIEGRLRARSTARASQGLG